ncbi:interleukin-18 receptor 1 [Rana temporaria]|uniref:interleukin-18 receptor 1 n=1 Tax=Rana temporaria TaxID=8407 RepID=UPI001AACFE0D|nr:interleukin-18 receptor 1 [Rana temporaria]
MYRQKAVCLIFGFACLMEFVYPCYFEDEYCVLKCDENTSKSNDAEVTIIWQKRLPSNALEIISADIDNRILTNGNLLEFWPLSLNDSGEYICTVQGKDYIKTLNVKKKNPNYCRDVVSTDRLSKTVGTAATINYNLPHKSKSTSYSVVWYKDCKIFAENVSKLSFEALKVSDSAIYAYVITHVHNGQYYNISGKTRLIVDDHAIKIRDVQEHVRPRIIGLGSTIITEVEMGQNVSVKCEASVGITPMFQFSWVHNKSRVDNLDDLVDDCKSHITKPCMTERSHKNKEGIEITELIIPSINEDDIKYPYLCSLSNSQDSDTKTYIFKLKDKGPDIPKRVFTTSIIAAVTCSLAIILLFALCISFRIEIVLLYRNITGLDETTGDSKEYDAYISFESYSSLKGEERDFALRILAPVLEKNLGFKLCIFERDVTPGGAMVDDMNAFLEKSRRLIIVFSKNYASDKVMYEMESGLHKAMVERNIKVILIEFTPLSELSYIPESLQLLKKGNRVKWKGEKSQPLNSRFWKKIQYLMPAKPALSKSDFHRLHEL